MKPPVIIVGAGRSGTKLLRSILAAHPDLAHFPREINYCWRYGQSTYPTDCLTPEQVTTQNRQYLQRLFAKQASDKRVIEKTCANSLRLDYVRTIFPEAQIIHIVRDGRSVTESAQRQWRHPQKTGYLWEKVRWVPLADVPYDAWRFLGYQIGRLRHEDRRAASWGPRFEGMDQLVQTRSLLEVCALQWQACVQSAHQSIQKMPSELGLEIQYESLIVQPENVVRQLIQWLDLPTHSAPKVFAQKIISPHNTQRWKQDLSEKEVALIRQAIGPTLEQFGYV